MTTREKESSSGSPLTALRQQAEQIKARLNSRRQPQIGTCQTCRREHEMQPSWQPIASTMAEAQWRCRHCGGQIQITVTLDQSQPSLDEDIATLLAALSHLQALTEAQAQEAAGSEDAFRIQGQELLHHIRECERLTAELARLQGGGYVQHLPLCAVHLFWAGEKPNRCSCGLSALIDPSRGEPQP